MKSVAILLMLLAPLGCRRRPMTLADYARFPVRATLAGYDPRAGTITLVVENVTSWPVYVPKVESFQVGSTVTHFSTAYQAGETPVHWLIWPGGQRRHTYDLNAIEFTSIEDGRTAPARKFVDELPERDRQFSVSVYTGGVQVMAYSR